MCDTTLNHNARVLKELHPGDLVQFDRDLDNWAVYVDTTLNHNARVLEELHPGDLVQFDRDLDSWAVYVGKEDVVHLTGDSSGQTSDSEVRLDTFWDVANGTRATKNNENDERQRPLRSWEIVNRAKEMVGKVIFDFLNCEHFAFHCRYGERNPKPIQEKDEDVNSGVFPAPTSQYSDLQGETFTETGPVIARDTKKILREDRNVISGVLSAPSSQLPFFQRTLFTETRPSTIWEEDDYFSGMSAAPHLQYSGLESGLLTRTRHSTIWGEDDCFSGFSPAPHLQYSDLERRFLTRPSHSTADKLLFGLAIAGAALAAVGALAAVFGGHRDEES